MTLERLCRLVWIQAMLLNFRNRNGDIMDGTLFVYDNQPGIILPVGKNGS